MEQVLFLAIQDAPWIHQRHTGSSSHPLLLVRLGETFPFQIQDLSKSKARTEMMFSVIGFRKKPGEVAGAVKAKEGKQAAGLCVWHLVG